MDLAMNWEIVSAVAEIIGALTIVITLIYLGFQLSHNTRSVKVSALQATMAQWNEWSSIVAGSPDLAEIVVRGNHDLHQLNPVDKLRYGAYIQMFFDAVETYHDQVNAIGLGGDDRVLCSIVRRRIKLNGIAQCWSENIKDYEGEFVIWIEDRFKEINVDDP